MHNVSDYLLKIASHTMNDAAIGGGVGILLGGGLGYGLGGKSNKLKSTLIGAGIGGVGGAGLGAGIGYKRDLDDDWKAFVHNLVQDLKKERLAAAQAPPKPPSRLDMKLKEISGNM